MASILPISSLPIEAYDLDPPPLSELGRSLKTALIDNYKLSSITLTPCPDLSKPPFSLSSPGICGNESIADVGGPPFLHPLPDFSKKYSLPEIISHCSHAQNEPNAQVENSPKHRKTTFAIGAGAGPFHVVGQNSELAPNLTVHPDGTMTNLTSCTQIGAHDEVVSGAVTGGSTDCGLMANLFISEGHSGDVLRITAKGRKGEESSFTEILRRALKEKWGDRCVSMGGVFVMRTGKAKMHVMPDFSKEPLGQEDMGKWLRFFDMESELVCLTTFHSHDPGLALRMEHTHCFGVGKGKESKGGHYHGDIEETKDEVEYEAYLNVAKRIWRIDRPA